jgi:regulation of enolase protein 1 (concanavalin A-like superfamily)
MLRNAWPALPRFPAAARLFLLALLISGVLCPHAAHGQTLPSRWTGSNIGSPSIAGRATYRPSRFDVDAAGTGIGKASDQFYFVRRKATGDVTIVARVRSIENTSPLAEAGVMIRESLSGDSRHAFAAITPRGGIGLHRRIRAGGGTYRTNVQGAAPEWLRLDRRGSRFTAWRSSDGRTWTRIGTARIPMRHTVYIGLAVSSYNRDVRATGSLADVDIAGGGSIDIARDIPQGRPPTVSLLWPETGATYQAPAVLTLVANATDTDNGIAQV